MLILPAIDLRGGQCVRLRQGEFDQETVFGSDPCDFACRWVEQGATYLHLVDLDGAREGRPVNGAVIQQIIKRGRVPCQLGGGLRDESHVDQAFAWGVERAVIGTRAVTDFSWLQKICKQYPGRIVLSIDSKHGRVATDGWVENSHCTALDLARRSGTLPLAALVYTDISRDGMLAGPNLTALEELASETALPIIASGGVSNLEDVRQIARVGIAGCIIGRALYEGRLTLPEVIKASRTVSGESRKSRQLLPDPQPLIPDS